MAQTNNTGFLPSDYTPPTSNYMKLKDGDNKFRILSRPIVGWEDWKDDKPHRFPMNAKPNAPFNSDKSIKHFWAFLVWNYKDDCIQILEVTQMSIQKSITNFNNHEDFGNPMGYDFTITKKGEKKETEYSTIASPPKPLNEKVAKLLKDMPYVNLDAMFEGGDPFVKPTA